MSTRPDPAVYRHSARFFVLFLAFTVWAFWPSYFARLFEQPSLWFHAHGVVLTAWLVLLVVQAQLIRTGRRAWHRKVGKLSYLLAPAVVIVTTIFVHQRVGGGLQRATQLPAMGLHFLALTLLSLVAFALFYGCAIWFRRDAERHARWMVVTVLPLFTPVTDRLIGAHLPPLIGLLPRIEGNPILPAAGFALADLIVLGLAWWDWRANRRLAVFPVALGVLLAYHVGTLTLHRVPAWNALCVWFLGLPFS
jgi:hypothetical protein